ncbi:hypothetical protein ACFC00_19930 [Streptomyces adustus]|uniref:hypothetical protein n=1 Tax=Streptomyces adustus TaxID=1609272 RepID=UPI0035DC99F2
MGNNNGGLNNGLGNNVGLDNNNGFGPRNIVAQPGVVAAGGRLTVTVDGCRTGGVMASRAFRNSPLRALNGTNDTARGVAAIGNNVRPGRYDITVDCNGRALTRPSAFAVIGGVRGGVGGSTSIGATPTDMAIGGGLVGAAGLGGVVCWIRRRAEKRV